MFSVRVSNELGLGRPRATKYSVYVTVFQSLLIGLVFMVIILITKNYFAVIFTSSKDLQVAVSKLAFLLGITMVLNSVQPVISGTDSNWVKTKATSGSGPRSFPLISMITHSCLLHLPYMCV